MSTYCPVINAHKYSNGNEPGFDKHTSLLPPSPFLTNGFSHHLGESTINFRGIRSDFIQFFDENSLSKRNSPRWDAAFCGITSGAMLFAYVPLKGCQAYMS